MIEDVTGTSRRAILRDVARLAGVHPATASRALNDETRHLVNNDTVLRVEEAARALDYRPHHLARSLKTRRSSTIGVVVPDLANPLFPPIVRGVEDRLASSGYVPLVGNTDNDDDRERLVLERLEARLIDGLIVATARRQHRRLVELASSGLPVVLVNRVVEGHRLPSVSADDSSGVAAAVTHLAELGHRQIAHLAGPQDLSTGAGRYRGFRSGIESSGLQQDPALVVFAGSFSEQAGYEGAQELLDRKAGATAIVAANDMLALGCLRALAERHIHCPGGISVVGFNDMPFVDRLSPPLTTVRLPQYDVGRYAAQLVLERIEEPEGPVKVLFLPAELVVRDSTGPVPTRRPSPGRRSQAAGSTAPHPPAVRRPAPSGRAPSTAPAAARPASTRRRRPA